MQFVWYVSYFGFHSSFKICMLLMALTVKNLPALLDTWIRSLSHEDPLEKGMSTHSGILAWKIPWTEEPGGLPSVGSQRAGQDSVTKHKHMFLADEEEGREILGEGTSSVVRMSGRLVVKRQAIQDFSRGPVVKTSLSNAVSASSTPGLGAKIPHTPTD